ALLHIWRGGVTMATTKLSPVTEKPNRQPPSKLRGMWEHIKRDRQFLIMLIPCIVFYLIFRYGPIYGLIIAFKDYNVFNGVWASEWVGLKHFEKFVNSHDFWVLFR